MNTVIALREEQRNQLLYYYRSPFEDPSLRLRCHIILLLADGHPWASITAVLYCSSRTISRWKQRFCAGDVESLRGRPPGRRPQLDPGWAALVVGWVTQQLPRDFGLLRSRWCCSLIVWLLCRDYGLSVSGESVQRWLRDADLVYRRPRPQVTRRDPSREALLQDLRELLRNFPQEETVVFQDEVDLNLHPEIGFCGMRRGHQCSVAPPGNNQKCYLAASTSSTFD